ncbi:hypothetical protein NW752_004255 [Fusarium irregulare]|uniref:Uncharacterized protein n=1 Tax=Fusarium irregulare TaxID=2494466 RepID=A0A9W8U9P5_9HYPO|nr:hypothetical protein NW766_007157 [Fusarium irregulare]KAJ4021248.1 hypothetical protein NW752_004255 [Fusarium irregulare]
MKRSLLLALWSAGALGSPCKPARDLSGNNYYPPPPPNNYAPPPSNGYDLPSSEAATLIASTQPGAVETHGSGSGSGSGDDEEGSVPTLTQGAGTQTTGPAQGDVTADPVSPDGTTRVPEASQASDADGVGVSGSPTGADGVATNSPGQPGDDGDDGSGSGNGNGGNGPQSSDGSSLADGVAATRTNTEGGSDATALPQTGDATEGAGGDATQTPGSGSGSGNGNDNADATQLPETGITTGANGQPTGDAGNGNGNGNDGTPSSEGSSLADGVAATQTGTDVPDETPGSGSGDNNGGDGNGNGGNDSNQTTVDGAVPTQGTPGSGDSTDSPVETPGSDDNGNGNGNGDNETTADGSVPTGAVPGNGDSTDSPDATQGQPDATTAGSGETGSPDSPDQTNVPGGQETSAGAPGSDDGSSPVTTSAGSDNTEAPGAGNGDGSETTGAAPEQSDVPGNGEQTTQVSGGDSPETTGTPDQTEGQAETVSTDENGVPTVAPGTNPDETTAGSGEGADETTVGVPDNTAPAGSETTAGAPGSNPDETTAGSPDNGADETTAPGPDNTPPVDNETSVNGDKPPETEDAPPATTEPAQDNTSVPAPDNNGPSSVEAVPTTDAGNDAPVTTAPVDGPGVTLNPAPVTTTAAPGTGGGNNEDDDDNDDDDNGGGGGGNNDGDDDDDDDDDNGGGGVIGGGGNGPGGSGGGSSGGGNNGDNNDNDDDNEDEDDDDEPTSTATSCTETATVTDCFVACTTYTGPAGATITPECSTTCTATHTGCSVTGTTTTSSAAACGPSDESCSTCNRRLVSEADPEILERRGIDLEKRGPRKAPGNVGGCKLAVMPQFPEYPGGSTVLNNEGDIVPKNSPLQAIKRWWLTTIDAQCLPLLRGNLDATTYIADSTGGDSDRPSIDHVYEKSMLLDFFRAIIDKNAPAVKGATTGGSRNKINCQDMEYYGGAGQNSKNNLLQKVFDAYPGAVENTADKVMVKDAMYLEDFIGMDQWTNGDAKGYVASPGTVKDQANTWTNANKDVKANTQPKPAGDRIEKKLDLLEKMAIGIEMFSAQEAIDAMIRQNTRIYARLKDIDDDAKGCKNDAAVKNNLWSFADRYKTFMQTRFKGTDAWSLNNEVVNAKTKLLAKLQTDLAAAAKIKGNLPANWNGNLASYNRRFNNMNSATRSWEIPEPAWDWSYVQKRDGSSGLSCDRPLDSETTTSEGSTTFATSTRMTSEESTTSEDKVTTTTEAPIKLTDLPTLTNAPALSISTPDGSSCASTATYTQCNLGTGQHGDACVTNSECASWVNTKTTSTTPSPTPTLDSPDASQNIKHCYGSGQKSNYEAITYAAESFCRDVVSKNKDNGYYWSNDKLEGKKTPSTGYHFKLLFSVNEGCLWKADYDECMRYMKVPIDSCNCSAKGGKQGGWVENNCITAKIDPNSGI